jgi:hypothetical protein
MTHQPTGPYAQPPTIRPAVQPWEPKPKPPPYRLLALMVIGTALAFPVAGIGIILLLVLGGEHVLTVSDARGVAAVATVVVAVAVVATAAVWADRSRELSRQARVIGWALVAVAAVPGIVGSVYFMRPHSPRNLVRPAVNGRAEVGSVLTVDPGRWTRSGGGRLSLDIQWQACGRGCTNISGATKRTYTPTRRELHRRIRFLVSATDSGDGWNDFSSDWVKSVETAPVRPSGR